MTSWPLCLVSRWKTLLPLAQAQSSIFKCFPVFLIFAVVAPSTCPHVPSLLFLVNPACTRWTAHPFIHTGHTHKVAVFKPSRAWSGNPVPPHGPVARLLTWYWWRSCDKRRSSYHFLFSLSASLFSSSAANERLSWGHEMSEYSPCGLRITFSNNCVCVLVSEPGLGHPAGSHILHLDAFFRLQQNKPAPVYLQLMSSSDDLLFLQPHTGCWSWCSTL